MTAQKSLPKPDQWLTAILRHVPEHGWTDKAMLLAATALGVDATLVKLVFPNMASDAVSLFHASIDERMEAVIEKNGYFDTMKIREKISFAVKTRLELMEGQQDAVRRLHGWAAHPKYARKALKMLWATCDKIWWLAGDTSTDYNHYSKRILLAQLYERTLVFWLDDKSRGHSATWEYLAERIEHVLQFGRKLGQLKDMAGMATSLLSKWRAA